MHVCAVSYKRCWQDESGRWMSYGGFPAQMGALATLFDDMTLIVEQGEPRSGGLPLPERARVVALKSPAGVDRRRKLSVLLQLPYYLGSICRHVRRADVVHTPLPGDIPLLGMLAAILFRRPLIARYGGSWSPTDQTTLMNRVTRGLMRTFSRGRNVMLATGEGAQPPAAGVEWIFSTALASHELERIQPDLHRGLFPHPRLVYIGRLSSEKGVDFLVRALATLQREQFQPLPRLTVIGDGPERPRLTALVAELGCEAITEFTGQLNRTDLSRQLLQEDLCVQPSLTEGFSKAWLDAMAHGLPVVASEVGAAASVLGARGERGWLTPPGDAAGLAAVLREVLAAPRDWPALRQRCRSYVSERTLEAWAHRIGSSCARHWNARLVGGKIRL